jgi:hypothetical protein
MACGRLHEAHQFDLAACAWAAASLLSTTPGIGSVEPFEGALQRVDACLRVGHVGQVLTLVAALVGADAHASVATLD